MRHRRTKAGITLEKLLHDSKNRYLFCWNGESEEDTFDCACCITWLNDEELQSGQCGCDCHERFEEMAQLPHIKLWLAAATAMDVLPKFFSSYAEKLTYCKGALIEHEATRSDWTPKQRAVLGDCQCEWCVFARNDLKTRRFAIEGEDNTHIEKSTRLGNFQSQVAEFEAWWSSTNNGNWFKHRTITVDDMKEAAFCAWAAADRSADVRANNESETTLGTSPESPTL